MRRVISVSRRTDVPAFYADWFLKRIKEGFAGDAKGARDIVSLKPEDVWCFVFWSKNYKPFLEALRFIDNRGYNSIFHFTITGLPRIFERGVVETEVAIDTFKEISERYSPEHITWRYDPIVISDMTSPDYHIERFEGIASSLRGYVERCSFSFVRLDRDVEKNLKKFWQETGVSIIDPDTKTKKNLADQLATIAEKYGIQLQVCWGNPLAGDKIKRSRCMDPDVIMRLFPIEGAKLRIKPTRPGCGCVDSTDIGADNTCSHGCVYCYANVNKEKARDAYESHYQSSVVLGYDGLESEDWMSRQKAKKQPVMSGGING